LKNTNPLPQLIFTERLLLFPFTTQICTDILNNNFDFLNVLGLHKGINWPDADLLETLPRIVINLSKVTALTGFESWIIVKKETNEIIGDIGFKGLNTQTHSCDIGYGILEAEQRKGYAQEATQGLLQWVLQYDATINITAATLLTNTSSIKLLQKLHFSETHTDDTFIYWQLVK